MHTFGIRVALVVVTLATLIGGIPAHASSPRTTDEPVAAANGRFSIMPVRSFNDCLTGHNDGRVTVESCSGELINLHQQWDLWFGGWAMNIGSGQCLTLKPGWSLATDRCDWGNRYQECNYWSTGWFQNHYDHACLTWDGGMGVKGQPCIADDLQYWYEWGRWT